MPSDGPHVRLLRVGLFFQELVARGHDVHWWTSDFDHQHRVHRPVAPVNDQDGRGHISMLPSPGYGPSVSLRRLWDHTVTARRFRRMARKAERPDVIVCSFPTIELSRAVVAYGIDTGVPVVLDIRDLWPDVIWDTVLPQAQGMTRDIALWPFRRSAAWAIRNATAVTGLTEAYVDWACALANRPRGAFDQPISLTYPVQPALTPAERTEGNTFWAERGVDLENDWVVAFLGTVGRQFDFGPVLAAAEALRQDCPDVRFVLCGSGEGLEGLRTIAAGLPNVLLAGWVEGPARRILLKKSRVGLAPYVLSENFRRNLPNKPVEYFAYGLPVAHSLPGVLDEACARAGSGLRYGVEVADGLPSLASVVRSLYGNDGKRAAMAAAARIFFETEFHPDTVTDRLLGLCEGLVHAP